MSRTEKIPLTCPCEKERSFEEAFRVKGPGSSRVQVRCPHPQCPMQDKWLSYDIPWELEKEEWVLRGGEKKHHASKP
jgi:hypothetical protein